MIFIKIKFFFFEKKFCIPLYESTYDTKVHTKILN
jgi:hypothetical protein